jgi:hypothetical protein
MTSTSFSTMALAQSSANITNKSGNDASKLKSADVLKNLAKNAIKTRIATTLEKIRSFSNIVTLSMVDGVKVNGISFGDTDLSVTLKREIAANNTTSNMSLPVTVIVVKLPVNNLTEILSAVKSLPDLAASTGSMNPSAATTGQSGSNAPTPLLSLLKNTQIGAGSIVNSNWTLPQTVSMGLLGPGNRVSAPNDIILVVVAPFQSGTNMPTIPLR